MFFTSLCWWMCTCECVKNSLFLCVHKLTWPRKCVLFVCVLALQCHKGMHLFDERHQVFINDTYRERGKEREIAKVEMK